ncbi:head-tail connector protein [Clostridium sp. 1001270J_160509_D11]|uniref:head-tail connector protein n=1 Tax=Clostridium sp. 1001270J_160509_D11 TaxID=2787103 RepID=UPI0018AC2A02
MLNKIKLALRISTDSFDEELRDLIDACKSDLYLSGVNYVNEDDSLIKRAIILYCKANFGLDNKDSEKYDKSYCLLKQHLALSGEYKDE